MPLKISAIIGKDGAIAKSKMTIYDLLNDRQELFLSTQNLENVLSKGLNGLKFDYALRTRSKYVKAKVCEILGYPVPLSFKRSKPRFPGQDFDTYIQKANNLQIWNDLIAPTRRYAIIKLDDSSRVTGVRVITGETLARLDKTGKLTKKYQAKSKTVVSKSVLVTKKDADSIKNAIQSLNKGNLVLQQGGTRSLTLNYGRFLTIEKIYAILCQLVGTRIKDPGNDQERNRGAELHRAVCNILGMENYSDNGDFPDILEQLLEVKLQTAQTIDLGLVSPDSTGVLEFLPPVRHCDVRYAVFYGSIVGTEVRLDHVILSKGSDFFTFFQRFEGKIVNSKLQMPLPGDFFD